MATGRGPARQIAAMKKIVLTFGLISGGILALLTAIHVPLVTRGTFSPGSGMIIGFSTMILAFTAVFFGIRAYRDNLGGGAITFGRAFKVGILIALITCAVYVIGWEIVYWGFIPDFEEKYAALTLERLRESGATPEKIAAETEKMEDFKRLYKNPLYNVGVTFLEIFPVGLIMTLISAAILRRKHGPGAPVRAAAAA